MQMCLARQSHRKLHETAPLTHFNVGDAAVSSILWSTLAESWISDDIQGFWAYPTKILDSVLAREVSASDDPSIASSLMKKSSTRSGLTSLSDVHSLCDEVAGIHNERREEMRVVDPVKTIQAELLTAAERLIAYTKKLRLVELMTELERCYLKDMDMERVGDGEACPPVAWEVHGDVGNAKILLEEVIGSLEKASRRTKQEVEQEWIDEKLKEVKDPATRVILTFFLDRDAESDLP